MPSLNLTRDYDPALTETIDARNLNRVYTLETLPLRDVQPRQEPNPTPLEDDASSYNEHRAIIRSPRIHLMPIAGALDASSQAVSTILAIQATYTDESQETSTPLLAEKSSLISRLVVGLTTALRVATSPQAGTVYTFIGMIATIVFGFLAWKLAQDSLDVSTMALNGAQYQSTKESNSASQQIPPRSQTTTKNNDKFLVSHPALQALVSDMMLFIVFTTVFISSQLMYFLFRPPKRWLRASSLLLYFMNPIMLNGLTKDCPWFATAMKTIGQPIYFPMYWEIFFIVLEKLKKDTKTLPKPKILVQLSHVSVHCCRVLTVYTFYISIRQSIVAKDQRHDPKHLGVAVKVLVLAMVAEVQWKRHCISEHAILGKMVQDLPLHQEV